MEQEPRHYVGIYDSEGQEHVRDERSDEGTSSYSKPYASITDDINFESNDDIDAALQLSFEESPEHSRPLNEEEFKASCSSRADSTPHAIRPFRSSPIVIQHTTSAKRSILERKYDSNETSKASPLKKTRSPSPHERYPQPASGPPPYPYPVYYAPHHPDFAYGPGHAPPPMVVASPSAQGSYHHYPVTGSSPHMQTPHLGGYPPPGYPPPGYPPPPPQWGSAHGQHTVYYMYHTHPYPHQPYEMLPPDSAERTPGKRKDRKDDANATMETAELSYEEDITGPASPPSCKKTKDSFRSAPSWPSPPKENVRDPMVSSYS